MEAKATTSTHPYPRQWQAGGGGLGEGRRSPGGNRGFA